MLCINFASCYAESSSPENGMRLMQEDNVNGHSALQCLPNGQLDLPIDVQKVRSADKVNCLIKENYVGSKHAIRLHAKGNQSKYKPTSSSRSDLYVPKEHKQMKSF